MEDLERDLIDLMQRHQRKFAVVMVDDGDDLIFLSFAEDNPIAQARVKTVHDWLLQQGETLRSLVDCASPSPSK